MPAGDPAGYLPSVRKARKRKGEPGYQPRSKQNLTQSSPGGGKNEPPQLQHDPNMQRPRGKMKPVGSVTFKGRMSKGGIDPRYRHSSFNPFGNKDMPPGRRIQRGADNHPNEGDSDYEGYKDRAKQYKGRKRG